MLKLGWANNILKNDRDAVKWFNLARQQSGREDRGRSRARVSQSGGVARALSHHGVVVPDLLHALARSVRLRAGQDGDANLHSWFVHPYVSLRFVGDTQGAIAPGIGFAPQYLSEGAAILGARRGHAHLAWRHGMV